MFVTKRMRYPMDFGYESSRKQGISVDRRSSICSQTQFVDHIETGIVRVRFELSLYVTPEEMTSEEGGPRSDGRFPLPELVPMQVAVSGNGRRQNVRRMAKRRRSTGKKEARKQGEIGHEYNALGARDATGSREQADEEGKYARITLRTGCWGSTAQSLRHRRR